MNAQVRRIWIPTLMLASIVACGGPSTTEREGLPELQVIDAVDLNRYQGRWFEIARIENEFQRGCEGTTATYTLRDDGDVDVLNRCVKEGDIDEAEGRARVVSANEPAKLEVSFVKLVFIRPFWGEYWIIELDDEYRDVVVGHPSRDYLWILSRTPQMSSERYDALIERLKTVHLYDVGRLRHTLQPETTPGANAG